MIITVRNTSENKISTLLQTTASVLAFPTSMEPPLTVYPKNDETLAMMSCKECTLDDAHPHEPWIKSMLYSKCQVIRRKLMCPRYAVAISTDNTHAGTENNKEWHNRHQSHNFRKDKVACRLTPIISSASICCVARIVPNSEAIFEPTFPARIRHMMLLENSRSIISRVVYPETQRGIHGLCMFTFICIQITAPMKNDISKTIPIELTPSWSISFIYCLKNILILSGRDKECPIRIISRQML